MHGLDEILESNELSGFRAYGKYHLGGKYVRKFEEEFADYFSVRYAVSMNSATACLHSALIALGIGKGDEVIVSPYSFSSSASCVLMVGATPVFCDIDENTFCIDPTKIKITPKTKAIIPVHLMGHPCDMNKIKLPIIEDCCQALGSKYHSRYVGTIGECGVFSFNQHKTVNTGEGGMLITDNHKIAEIARAVRNHAEVSRPDLKIVGYNYRMTEIEACIGRERFKELDSLINIRIKNAEKLTEGLKNVAGTPIVKPKCKHTFYTYALKVKDKEKFCKEMGKRRIYFGTYLKPLYLLPIYGYEEGLCPVTEKMWRELAVTDIIKQPDLDTDKVISSIKSWYNI